ncbi:hypothetical protein ACFU6S_19125 [Streptomyces sp. NPDC057456]|uniref:hypothetical protein n=1 Tax=Streptomyces sp. NPDC057456 TaxID=3346139 RepID=UPI0036B06A1C
MKRGPPTPPTPLGERGEIRGEVADADAATDADTATCTGADTAICTGACTDPPAPGTTGRPRRGLRSRRGL